MVALAALSMMLVQQSPAPTADKPAPVPAATQASEMTYPFNLVDVRPKILHQVEAQFSREAEIKKITGTVEVYVVIQKDGSPSHIRVTKGLGHGLDEQAVEAVRQYTFSPGIKNGVPVKTYTTISISFQLL